MRKLTPLLAIVAAGATVGLFFMLGPQVKSTLFYFNMCFLVLLELLFFGSIFVVSKKSSYNVQSIAVAAQITKYTIVAAILLAISWLIPIEYILWYYAAHIILAVIFLALIIFVGQAGQVQKEVSESYAAKKQVHKVRQMNFTELQSTFNSAISGKNDVDPIIKNEAMKAIRSLVERASMCTPSIYELNPDFADAVQDKFNNMKSMAMDLAIISEKDKLEMDLKKLTIEAQSVDQYIKVTKQTLR